jgi:hypothetical protein
MGIDARSATADLRSRIEVRRDWDGSVMSRGGFRRERRETEMVRSAPGGVSFCRLGNGCEVLGRMSWGMVSW